LKLATNDLRDAFEVADLASDPELARIVALAAASNVVIDDE
jgi:hypothetical protein